MNRDTAPAAAAVDPSLPMSDAGVAGVDAAARLDRLPVSRFHYRMLFLIAGGLFFDQFDIQMAAGVASALLKEGISTLELNALFFSATFVGLFIGAVVSGIVGDRFGRRLMYRVNLAVVGLATVACALAPSMEWLIIFRLIAGIGLGAEGATSFAALAEFVPPHSRGKWVTGASMLGTTAIIFASLLNYYLLPLGHWRAMFWIAGIGALVFWVLRFSLPESPRWLQSKGRDAEAERVLAAIEREASGGRPLPPPVASPPQVHRSESIRVLFSKNVRHRTVIACLVNLTVTFAGFGFIAWLPTMFMKQGQSMDSALALSTVIVIGGPLGSLCAVLISDRVGRRRAVVVISLLTAVFGSAFALVTASPWVAIFGFFLIAHIYMLAVLSTAGYVPELFPTEYRLRGAAMGSAVGRIAAVVAPYIILFLFNYGGLPAVVAGLVSVMIFQAFIIFIWGIETKGLSLEEIARRAAAH